MEIGNKFQDGIEDYREQKIKEEKAMFLSNLELKNAYDNIQFYYNEQPFFYDKSQNYWFWSKKENKWDMVDETDLIISIGQILQRTKAIVTGVSIKLYMRCIQTIGRQHIPKEPPNHWIQFKGNIYDIKTKEIFPATPEYFFCNPIPFEIGASDKTPTMDKLFSEWVGEEHKQTLYEILAYCCLCDYPIHSLFCFIGAGRNGKSRFLALIDKFIGSSNCISTELDSLAESRFESAKLYKKSVCFMGETNFGILEKTSILKKLTGQDKIGGEFKGKDPFDFRSYAKLCIASNSLPSSTDTSEGFYRRWMIIDFPNNFSEGKDILDTIPQIEYNNLANKILNILPELIERGTFSNQGTIEQRKNKYIMASNPFSLFMKQCCNVEANNYIKHTDLYVAYLSYLQANKRRRISRKEFARVLEDEGLISEKKNINYESGYYVCGLELKKDWEKYKCDKCDKCDVFHTSYMRDIQQSTNYVTNVTNVTNVQKEVTMFINKSPRVFLPCKICKLSPLEGNILDSNNEPICELCFEGIYKGEPEYLKVVNKN